MKIRSLVLRLTGDASKAGRERAQLRVLWSCIMRYGERAAVPNDSSAR
ncbi:MAG: hypothetical protein ACFB9N_01295 [Geitlerinemataceae cyanobacterium]